jgi:hypothetical protein
MLRTALATILAAAALTGSALTPPPAGHRAPTDAVVVPAAKCGGKATGLPLRKWGPTSQSTCGLAGSPGHRVSYGWNVGPGGGKACVEGWGFDEANPKGRWFPLGCATASKDYGKEKGVPWGNVLARPKVRVQSQDALRGVQVDWRH